MIDDIRQEQQMEGMSGVRSRHWLLEPLRRLRKNRAAMVAGGVVLFYVFLTIFGPLLAPHDPLDINPPRRFERPSMEFPFGTDSLGRCLLSRVLVGARISFMMGFIAVAIALFVGGTLGLMAGYFGSFIDDIISRFVDVMMAFPSFLLAVVIVAALGPGIFNCMVAVGVASVAAFVRLTRSTILSFREHEFAEAARAAGASDARIMFRHLVPNITGPVIVFATLRLSTAILSAAALSFLGLGAQPPTPEWGAMAAAGRQHLIRHPHIVFFPSLVIFIMVLAFNFLGDGLRDALDPRQSD